ncbi:MAG: branched-chain amino acid ABC transporter permease [Chloroflexota bacterium]|nr:branched-chain amino acid ABC transporter permease [Chloroflexota bacterium]
MRSLIQKVRSLFIGIPIQAWVLGFLAAAAIERLVGGAIGGPLGLEKVPRLFGLRFMLKSPLLIPSVIAYLLAVYLVPVAIVARLTAPLIKRLPSRLSMPLLLVVLYGTIHVWGGLDEYRMLVLQFILISILLTVSLNLVNGYMGEFSCASGGFMAVGAYIASILTVGGFVHDDVFGPPILPPSLGFPLGFVIALIIGGLIAALAALLVAIPSFRTRGDYLAVISLAVTFILKSTFENLEVIGGPRGFMNQPRWASLPVIFAWTIMGVWIMRNYVSSILGKGATGVRDDETAAEVMTVRTRRVKVITFMLSAFWTGIAGGLFAHVMGYINPATFGIMKTAECIAMLYMGGLNSITGAIVGAVIYQFMLEALRPLGIAKWMVIPLIVFTFMLRRPWGLIAFREAGFLRKEVRHAPASD